MELLYADDLVLISETKELLLEKVRNWKKGMEKKGLRVNTGKIKVMWCRLTKGQAEDSGEHPLGKIQGVISYSDGRGASYRIKGRIYRACVQSALTYGTETWTMKKANLQSLERTQRMMVRWMCGVSLKDRKRSVDLYSLLGVQSVDEVVRRGRLRWFGHVEHKSEDD